MMHAVRANLTTAAQAAQDGVEEDVGEAVSGGFMPSAAATRLPSAAEEASEIQVERAASRGRFSSELRASPKVFPEPQSNTQKYVREAKGGVKDRGGSKDVGRSLDADRVAMDAEKAVERSALPHNRSRFLVRPNSPFRNRFDVAVIVALLYVSIVTPFEVAFLADASDLLVLTVLNRIIDAIFLLDIALNFLTPVATTNGQWITSHRIIAWRYLTSWFFVDVMSVLPFEMLKMVRLVRLTKLLRIFRASRVLKRWETRISISYGYITLTKFVTYMIMLSHWLACLFRLVPIIESGVSDFSSGEINWVEEYFVGMLGHSSMAQVSAMEQYNAALYWAVMTVTTIGYGDVTPKTDVERWVVIISMMVGGSAYAYIVGSVCGLLASMGELTARLHRKIDDLNVYMEEQKLPTDVRIKLREFFHYTAKQYRRQHYRLLLQEMSPEMRGDVYRRVNERWVMMLPFMHCASAFERPTFVTALAEALVQDIFPPQEHIARPGEISRDLNIIERGVVMMNKSYFVPPELSGQDQVAVQLRSTTSAAERVILTRGMLFGHEMLLTDARRRYYCISLTYVEMHRLSKKALETVFATKAFPETLREYRKHVIKLAFRMKFVAVAKKLRAQQEALERLSQPKIAVQANGQSLQQQLDAVAVMLRQANESLHALARGEAASDDKRGQEEAANKI